MEADITATCADLGLHDYRPRFSPIVRALLANGPCSIRRIAELIQVTHSAASQTVAQMRQRGLVTLAPGTDARERIVALTDEATRLVPAIQAEWAATDGAVSVLDAELPCPLGDLVAALAAALEHRPFRARIADAAGTLADDVVGPYRAALGGTSTRRIEGADPNGDQA